MIIKLGLVLLTISLISVYGCFCMKRSKSTKNAIPMDSVDELYQNKTLGRLKSFNRVQLRIKQE